MPTDFSSKATDVSTSIEAGARLVEPVSRAAEIDALDNIGKGVASGAKTVATIFRNKAQTEQNKVLADFTTKLTEIDDAMEQGISVTEGSTKKRALFKQYLGAHPELEEDLNSRFDSNRPRSGFSDIDTEAQQRAKMEQDQAKAAVQGGWLSDKDMNDPDKRREAIANVEAYQKEQRELEINVKRINAESSKLELGSKRRTELQEEHKQVVLGGLAKIGARALPYWQNQFNLIKDEAASAPDEASRQRIIKNGIARLEEDFAKQTSALTGNSLEFVGQEKIDQLLKPQRNLIDVFTKQLSGEYDAESAKKYAENAEAQAKMLVWMDLNKGNGAKMVAASNLFKENASVLFEQLNTEAVKMFGQNGEGPEAGTKPADIVEYSSDNTKYLGGVTTLITKANKGEVSGEGVNELNNQVNNILRGVDVFSGTANSAKEFQPVIDFFSNPEVAKYIQSNQLSPELRAKASKVIGDGYASYVVPLVKDTLGSDAWAKIRVGDQKYDYNQLVDPVVENGRFGFKLKEGIPDDINSRAALRQMNNSSLTKVVGRMLASHAAINGIEVEKSYEIMGPQIFDSVNTGGATIDTNTTGSVKADFSLEDLVKQPPGSFTSVTPDLKKAASGSFTGNSDKWINETDPLSIAKSFKGVDEVKDAKVLASFIKKTTGMGINPAKTAWCAAFVNGVLGASGGQGTGSLAARSFLNWGDKVSEPEEGDVAVFSRGSDPSKGHVGFYMGEEVKDGVKYIRVLSGNQSDSVNESLYPASKLLGYRRSPKDM